MFRPPGARARDLDQADRVQGCGHAADRRHVPRSVADRRATSAQQASRCCPTPTSTVKPSVSTVHPVLPGRAPAAVPRRAGRPAGLHPQLPAARRSPRSCSGTVGPITARRDSGRRRCQGRRRDRRVVGQAGLEASTTSYLRGDRRQRSRSRSTRSASPTGDLQTTPPVAGHNLAAVARRRSCSASASRRWRSRSRHNPGAAAARSSR